ncbi:hypothetical protein HDU76_010535 [Blyttiomyces sp. JEL0837]|nr:hypothetical protein HDU76_010535 [Blyttiomyces sp. JEL0837]
MKDKMEYHFTCDESFHTPPPYAVVASVSESISKPGHVRSEPQRRDSAKFFNLWDHLPYEIKCEILQYADPVTKYLNGLIPLSYQDPTYYSNSTNQTCLNATTTPQSLWQIVFSYKSTFFTNASLLPSDELPNVWTGLCKLTSRSLYLELCKLRPDLLSMDVWKFIYVNKSGFGKLEYKSNKGFIVQLYSEDPKDIPGLVTKYNFPLDGVCGNSTTSTAATRTITPQTIDPVLLNRDVYFNDHNEYNIRHGIPVHMESLQGHLLHVPMRNLWLDLIPPFLFTRPIVLGLIAILFGHARLLDHLIEKYHVDPRLYKGVNRFYFKSLSVAAERGFLDVVQILDNAGCENSNIGGGVGRDFGCVIGSGLSGAIENGFLDVVRYFVEVRGERRWRRLAMDNAARGGHLDVLIYLHGLQVGGLGDDTGDGINDGSNVVGIGGNGANVTGFSGEAMRYAVMNGRLDVVKWLWENRPDAFDPTMAMDGYFSYVKPRTDVLPALQFLHEVCGVPCTERAAVSLAIRGRLQATEYVITRRQAAYEDDGLERLAQSGAIEFVKAFVSWALVERYLIDDEVDALTFLLDHGDHNDAFLEGIHLIDLTACHGRLDIIKLFKAKFKGTASLATHLAMDISASNGHLQVLKFLHYNGFEDCTSDAMDLAASNGHLQVLQFLHMHTSKGCTTRAMDIAAERGFLNVVKWLHENRQEGCTQQAVEKAASQNFLGIVKYLMANRKEVVPPFGAGTICAVATWQHSMPPTIKVAEMIALARTKTPITLSLATVATSTTPSLVKYRLHSTLSGLARPPFLYHSSPPAQSFKQPHRFISSRFPPPPTINHEDLHAPKRQSRKGHPLPPVDPENLDAIPKIEGGKGQPIDLTLRALRLALANGDIDIALNNYRRLETMKLETPILTQSELESFLILFWKKMPEQPTKAVLTFLRKLSAELIAVADEGVEFSYSPSEEVAYALLEAHMRADGDNTKQVLEIWNDMSERGTPMNLGTYNLVLKYLADNKNPSQTAAVFQQLLQASSSPEGEGVDDEEYEEEMDDGRWRPSPPDEKSYLYLITAYANSGQVDRARSILDAMLSDGSSIQPNIAIFNVMIRAYGHSGDFASASQIFEQMQMSGHRPSSATYNILIDSYVKAGDDAGALRVFEAMKQEMATRPVRKQGSGPKEFGPNRVTYNTLIGMFAKKGLVNEAEMTFKAMTAGGAIFPDRVTVMVMLTAYRKAGDPVKCREAFAKLHGDWNIPPSVQTYNVLMGTLLDVGDYAGAWEVYTEMVEAAKLQPLRSTFRQMIGACRDFVNVAECEKWFDEMLRVGIEPDASVLEPLLLTHLHAATLTAERVSGDGAQAMLGDAKEDNVNGESGQVAASNGAESEEADTIGIHPSAYEYSSTEPMAHRLKKYLDLASSLDLRSVGLSNALLGVYLHDADDVATALKNSYGQYFTKMSIAPTADTLRLCVHAVGNKMPEGAAKPAAYDMLLQIYFELSKANVVLSEEEQAMFSSVVESLVEESKA